MLPSVVMVRWSGVADYWLACSESTDKVVLAGGSAFVARWLRQHSYVGVWGLRGGGVMGHYVRKERA